MTARARRRRAHPWRCSRCCSDPQGVRHPSNLTGAGETIVIVDAFQNPTIVNDLALFDATFGLPTPTLNIIAPQGLTPFDPNANQV